MRVPLLLLLLQTLALPPRKQTYLGGRRNYSYLTLTLWRDSTFRYTSQYHFEPKARIYHGTWHKAGTRLVLTSRPRKRAPVTQANKTGLFHQSSFRLSGDTLYLYTPADSINSYPFCRSYKTLIRQH